MKKIAILLVFTTFSYYAQYPLKTDYTELPNNSYIKDLGNELPPFTGIYTATFQNNIITLNLSLENHKLIYGIPNNYYKDIINLSFLSKNNNGLSIYDTQVYNFSQTQRRHTIRSLWVEDNGTKLLLYYGGTNCGVGWGTITLSRLNSTQLSWTYEPNSTLLDNDRCPPGTDITIYIPEVENLVFTKQ